MTPETACPTSVRNGRPVDPDDPVVQNRELCGHCFPDGEIPDHVDEIVVGHRNSKAHLPAEYDVDPEVSTPDDPTPGSEGIAAKIGAEDVGPEDIGLSQDGSLEGGRSP